ncbi:guanylate cyclase soluble subunit beta-2-like [Tubulanus polymorphus]|uniref:guanylate cyclase soluble subunit beta-2-like n=1 Tax=Tubulanus polymorphus TaxID=672921 RepID=UPI003DA21DFF
MLNYGQIHSCVRKLVLEKFGETTWKKIIENCGLDEVDHFMIFHRYDDSLTFQLVGSVGEILGIPIEAVLEVFGEYFLTYCMEHGYDKMLRTLGEDFKTFIQNLDSLHALLAMTYKNIEAPSFRCDENKDGTLNLHYYTVRPGLYPIVSGLVKAVAIELFGTRLTISVVSVNEELVDETAKPQEHVVFLLKLTDDELGVDNNQSASVADLRVISRPCTPASQIGGPQQFMPFCPVDSHISNQQFCKMFPYHIVFDENLEIKQSGCILQKLLHQLQAPSVNLDCVFRFSQPRMPITIENIHKFINAVFVLESKHASTGNEHTVLLKGQMSWMKDTKHMMFIGSPRLSSLNELEEKGVFLSDIPLYDVTRELVLLNQQRIAEIEISKKLDETTAELKKTAVALEKEKQKTDTLLHQMLPVKVAEQLRNGLKVDAEKFEEVTILFSDIVTFTNIAAACSPLDIVKMLNAMYLRFDRLTTKHDVYKVETIGDAYMVVGGVPEPIKNHAEKVANFALDMIEKSMEVHSPATGKPLQIRVGIHTGPVVAGVVGDKMPRYCLFGDTVNTASRMESHGQPGRIHLSPTTKTRIADLNYGLTSRGVIEVKGKGRMCTYFLIGRPENPVPQVDIQITLADGSTDGLESAETFESTHKHYDEFHQSIDKSNAGQTETANKVDTEAAQKVDTETTDKVDMDAAKKVEDEKLISSLCIIL